MITLCHQEKGTVNSRLTISIQHDRDIKLFLCYFKRILKEDGFRYNYRRCKGGGS